MGLHLIPRAWGSSIKGLRKLYQPVCRTLLRRMLADDLSPSRRALTTQKLLTNRDSRTVQIMMPPDSEHGFSISDLKLYFQKRLLVSTSRGPRPHTHTSGSQIPIPRPHIYQRQSFLGILVFLCFLGPFIGDMRVPP